MDTVKALHAFAKVVELGSFAAAAERLNQSRSALTKTIAALERHYGVRLLHRTTRQLSLTEAGRTLLDGALPLLGELDTLTAQLREGAERPRGVLRIGAPLSFGVRHLAPLVSSYLDAHPEVQIDLELSDRQVDLVEDGFDLAIRIGQLADSSLVAAPLGDIRLEVCAAPAYLARQGHPQHPRDLKTHRCLLYSYAHDGHDWRFQRGAEHLQVRVGGPLRANNGSVLLTAALAGQGIIRQPDFLVDADLASGRLVRLFADWQTQTVSLQAVYPHRRLVPAKMRSFLAWLRQHLAPAAVRPGAP